MEDYSKYEATTAQLEEPKGGLWWSPAAGENINGKVVAIFTRAGRFGEETVLELDTMSISCNKVLKGQLDKNKVVPGTVIGVKYFGMRNSVNGDTKYKLFAVAVHDRKDEIPF